MGVRRGWRLESRSSSTKNVRMRPSPVSKKRWVTSGLVEVRLSEHQRHAEDVAVELDGLRLVAADERDVVESGRVERRLRRRRGDRRLLGRWVCGHWSSPATLRRLKNGPVTWKSPVRSGDVAIQP